MEATDREDVRVELGVRSLGPSGQQSQQDTVIERLDALDAAGTVTDFEVSIWGKRVQLDGAAARTRPGEAILSKVEAFEGWATRNDLSIGTFFETKRIRSELAGEDYRAIELPTMTLAEYHGDDLHWVSPCMDPDTGTVYTVRDRIEMLETGGTDLARTPAPSQPPMIPEE